MASCLRHFFRPDKRALVNFRLELLFYSLPFTEVFATEGQAALLRRALADGRGVLGVIIIGVRCLGLRAAMAARDGDSDALAGWRLLGLLCPRWRQGAAAEGVRVSD